MDLIFFRFIDILEEEVSSLSKYHHFLLLRFFDVGSSPSKLDGLMTETDLEKMNTYMNLFEIKMY